MKKHYLSAFLPLFFFLASYSLVWAQATISGTIKDGGAGGTLAGVNIVVKGSVAGTISNTDGQYSLKVNQPLPFILSYSFIGFKTQEVEIKDPATALDITMEEQTLLGQEVVVAASRVEESILKSPVTVEKMDLITIKQAAAPDFYDALASVKGVQVNNGSLNFTAVNTRGFATIANVRFVQWVDGMDTQAPLLNFPTGNIIGLGELDAESVELVPGAASALYGPNAFNGILIMKSKNPFEFQGLSAQIKEGINTSKAGGSHPAATYSIRYAKAFNNKFAFKINFSYMKATDWTGNDYKTDRNVPDSNYDLSGNPNFDGVNKYGDETKIPVPIGGTFGTLDLRRTGFKEEDLLDNRDAKSIKGDVALHYRITDKIEASYNYRYGGGSSIYQGQAKYALRDFSQQFHKLEIRGDNFFVRVYTTATDAGKSYNLDALGGFLNEALSPTASKWAPEYAQTYVLATQGYVNGVPAGNPAAAHQAARAYADRNITPLLGTQVFKDSVNAVRSRFFQRTPPGASFYDNSKLYHGEVNYKFFNQIKWAEIQVGGNVRQYSLFSNGTIFNEAPDDGVNFKRITINEFGVYGQISKTLADALKLTGSIRYDKNENFEGHFTPRVSAVYTIAGNQNIRASYQTGFRNPDTQAQYIFFPNASGTLIGSTKSNGERYGIFNGGAYTQSSFAAFTAGGGTINPTTGALGGNASAPQPVTADIPYIQPEQLQSGEVGYKGLIASKLLVDLNYYYTEYKNFLGSQYVVGKNATIHQDKPVPAGTIWVPYINATQKVMSWGFGAGLSYSLPANFIINGSYNFANYKADESPDFLAGFNTPRNKYTVGLGNRKVTKNLGFNVTYRWQEGFDWVSSYVGTAGSAKVGAYGVADAQINYKISEIKTMIKIGGTNIGGGDYRTNFGSPYIGQQYYVSLTFDEFLK